MQIGILEPRHFSKSAITKLKKYGDVSLHTNVNFDEFLADKEVLFIRLKYQMDSVFFEKAKKLKYICSPTTGLNHVDLVEANKRNIKIICLKGETEFLSTIRATPEHTFGLLLSLLRNYKKAFLNTNNENWNRDLHKGFEVYKKTIGIIGMGRVGKILTKYITAFGGEVLYVDVDIVNGLENAKKLDTLDKLIEQSDIIFLTASYSEENEKMINKHIIDLMKNKYFINTARGELVDEEYLMSMVLKNHFSGVALDVISNETDIQNNNLKKFLPLCDTHNFILTPHIAGATYESMWRTEEFIADQFITKIN